MADREEINQANNDRAVEAARKGKGLDADKALSEINDRLSTSEGYYIWTAMGEGRLATWQVRIPREDKADEEWMKHEAAEIIHICKPAKFLEAFEKREKERLSSFCGYVREAACSTCKKDMPEKLHKKAAIQTKMHALGKKL
jgi:hypothetical protein